MTTSAMVLLLSIIAAPPATAPSSAPAGVSAEVQKLIDRACRQYETAQSYEGTLSLSSEIEAAQPLDLPGSSEVSLAFVRPNKLVLRTELCTVLADGRTLSEAMDVWMQYRQAPAPAALKLQDISLTAFGFFRDGKHPLLPLLLQADRSSFDALNGKANFTAMRPDSFNGSPGKRATGTMGPEGAVVLEVWFDDATGLIGEVVYDHTQAARKSAPNLGVKKLRQRLVFKNTNLNQPIGDERFTFTPASHLEKVSAFKMPTSQEMQHRLVGKPAVQFTGKYLDGKEVSLDTFKGRVLLLDFWSLRCGPCIYSMPTLQKVADKYAGKPVSVVGVNLDGESAATNVRQLLESRKITFAHMMQSNPRLAEKYFVEGIPCAVLIDGKGTIQSIHLGMADERQMSDQIDRLLKGENLFKK